MIAVPIKYLLRKAIARQKDVRIICMCTSTTSRIKVEGKLEGLQAASDCLDGKPDALMKLAGQ